MSLVFICYQVMSYETVYTKILFISQNTGLVETHDFIWAGVFQCLISMGMCLNNLSEDQVMYLSSIQHVCPVL